MPHDGVGETPHIKHFGNLKRLDGYGITFFTPTHTKWGVSIPYFKVEVSNTSSIMLLRNRGYAKVLDCEPCTGA